jgi:hypothetical protein
MKELPFVAHSVRRLWITRPITIPSSFVQLARLLWIKAGSSVRGWFALAHALALPLKIKQAYLPPNKARLRVPSQQENSGMWI